MTIDPSSSVSGHRKWPIKKRFWKKTVNSRVTVHDDRKKKGPSDTAGKIPWFPIW